MDRENARAALADAERRERAVARRGRWGATLLGVWAATTLVVEIATAFLSGPWTLLAVGVMAVFVAWAAIFAYRQRVTSRGFAVRYATVVALWGLLHVANMVVLASGGHGNRLVAVVGGVVVAAPLAVGAVIEGRRS